jgi:beta-lactam-binding protein with PASTA domain
MSFFKFLTSKSFFINLGIAIAVIIAIYFTLIYSLGSYTHHGEKVIVPDFKGLTYKDAVELAQQSQLKVIVSDTTYSNEQERGLIAAQIPAQSSEVKSERSIYLTINSMAAEKISMPNFVGASLRQAIADAEIIGLKIGEINYVPDIAKNNVLAQSINGKEIPIGTKINKGSFIDLTLGMGLSNEKVFIPLLINKTVEQADSMLRAKYLNTGAKFYDESIKTLLDSSAAIIFKQEPEPFNKNFKPGDFVDIWLTLDSTKIVIKPEWTDSLRTDTNIQTSLLDL